MNKKPIANEILDEIKEELKSHEENLRGCADEDADCLEDLQMIWRIQEKINKLEIQALKPMQENMNELGILACYERHKDMGVDKLMCKDKLRDSLNKFYESGSE